jgi:hypothetical protein
VPGNAKLRGDNLKVVWAEFSTLKMGVFVYIDLAIALITKTV